MARGCTPAWMTRLSWGARRSKFPPLRAVGRARRNWCCERAASRSNARSVICALKHPGCRPRRSCGWWKQGKSIRRRGTEPAHWRLLTTHSAASLAAARHITGFYRQRWIIEQLFRVMKTKGFDIEAVRIIDEEPFENLTAATLIAAIQVLQMVRDRDGTAARPLEDVFETADQPALEAVCATLEGKTERQKNPHPKATLAYATWVCARLGGWTGYYGKPGTV